MAIRVLSEQLASQIKAGEVVERPASAVKELVENAIDAGATTINVTIRKGGSELIQVADNGSGIAADDVETAFAPHATSKLDSVETLAAIPTLGFRGEALAAIASVSRIMVVTRARGETAGVRLVLEEGRVVSRELVGAAQGTLIAVENLFYTTPARRKFLKSERSERGAIGELITRYALAYPDIRFRLNHDGRETFQSNGSGDVRDVLVNIYDVDIGRAFIEVARQALPVNRGEVQDGVDGGVSAEKTITISGYVLPPAYHRSNRSHISLFVNGRWIKDQQLTFAVIEAFHTLIPKGRYPIAVMFVDMPFEDVDVNVHPLKREVRFQYPRKVFSRLQRAIVATLRDGDIARSAENNYFEQLTPSPWGQSRAQTQAAPSWGAQSAFELGHGDPTPPIQNGAQIGQEPQPALKLGGERLPIMRVVGQIRASFIITEGPEGMYLVDQHAAHERILFEQFMRDWQRKSVASQQLVTGLPVQIPPAQSALLEENLTRLAQIGFVVEPFGPGTFNVRAVPALLAKIDPARALNAMVDDLEEESRLMQTEVEEAMIKKACKTAAVKAGQVMSLSEMEALMRQLEECEVPQTCPHGRPTLIHLSMGQLVKSFGR